MPKTKPVKFRIGSRVRLKRRIAGKEKRLLTDIAGFIGPDVPGGVVLAAHLGGMRAWNVEDLELIRY